MKNGRRTKSRVEMLDAALASGIGQAIAGWAVEYTHSLLERDPELRAQLRRNWLLMYERIARTAAQAEKPRRRRDTRRRT